MGKGIQKGVYVREQDTDLYGRIRHGKIIMILPKRGLSVIDTRNYEVSEANPDALKGYVRATREQAETLLEVVKRSLDSQLRMVEFLSKYTPTQPSRTPEWDDPEDLRKVLEEDPDERYRLEQSQPSCTPEPGSLDHVRAIEHDLSRGIHPSEV